MQFEYKILLIGDHKTGKSAFVERLNADTFTKEYTSTEDGDITDLKFDTTYGDVTFSIWEIPPSVEEHFYRNSDAAICMFDVHTASTLNHIPKHIKNVLYWNCNFTVEDVVLCGSLADTKKVRRDMKSQAESLVDEITTFFISSKKDKHVSKVMLHIARKLTGFQDLEFRDEDNSTITMEDYGEWSSEETL